jgi:hypothetical protein
MRRLRGKICVETLTSIRLPGPQGFNLVESSTTWNQAAENTAVIQSAEVVELADTPS